MSADVIRDGIAAGRDLEQLKAAFESLRADYVKQWVGAKDIAERERLHAKVSVLDEVQTQLRAAAGRGAVASKLGD